MPKRKSGHRGYHSWCDEFGPNKIECWWARGPSGVVLGPFRNEGEADSALKEDVDIRDARELEDRRRAIPRFVPQKRRSRPRGEIRGYFIWEIWYGVSSQVYVVVGPDGKVVEKRFWRELGVAMDRLDEAVPGGKQQAAKPEAESGSGSTPPAHSM